MKVASCFSLENKSQEELNMWIETLPIKLRAGQKEIVWLHGLKKKTVVWTALDGFVYY